MADWYLRFAILLCALTDIPLHASLRLVGYIVRQSDNNGLESTKYSCFVYEADISGIDVCSALGVAAKAAYEQLVEKKTIEKKRKQETVRIFSAVLFLVSICPKIVISVLEVA